MYKTLILISFAFLTVSCKSKEEKSDATRAVLENNYDKINNLKWLVGNWTNITPDQQSYESWTQINDSLLTAYSYTTVRNDTVFQENMTIQQDLDKVVLIVITPNQNDEKPVVFNLLRVENNVFTFENKQHDFPSKITYTNPVKDSIHAWIEGKIDSTYKKIDFYFKRSN